MNFSLRRLSIISLILLGLSGCFLTTNSLNEFYTYQKTFENPISESISIGNYTEKEQKISFTYETTDNPTKMLDFVIEKKKIKILHIGEKIKFTKVELENKNGDFYMLPVKDKEKIVVGIGIISKFNFKGKSFKFLDSHPSSVSTLCVKDEILVDGEYCFDKFECTEKDIMIDIGAHVGMVSILYGKLYPQLKIYAFEPDPRNYKMMLMNIKLNNVKNITPFNMAVSGDGRELKMCIDPELSAVGTQTSITSGNKKEFYTVQSTTIKDIFEKYNIDTCKFLKIDCEGSEYEILLNTPTEILQKIEFLGGEFHTNDYIKAQGYSPHELEKYCILNSGNNFNIKIKKVWAPL